MRPPLPIHCRQFTRVFLLLSFLLAWFTLGQNLALGQQRIFSPEPQQQSHRLNLRFTGERPSPLAMVSGDFDEDGVADLVVGYGLEKGGSIALLRGNPDAIAPRTEAGWLAAGRHEYIDPFIQRLKPISTKIQPNLMVSADVNGDGHLDLVYAARGSSALYVLFGTGQGTFTQQPVAINLPGGITALASYRPGMPLAGEAVIVGYTSGVSGRLGIVSYGATGLTMKASYTLPNAPIMLTVANLDTDFIPDTAIVAGGELLVLHGKNAINGGGQMEVLPVNGAEAVAAGDFLFDRHAQTQLSVVTSNGRVVVLAHQGFDPRPYTPQQIAAARHSKVSPSLAQQAGNTGSEPWVEVESHAELILQPRGSEAPILLRSRLSGSGGDDLVVMDPAGQQRAVISHPSTVPSFQSTLASSFVRSGRTQPGVEQVSPSRISVSSLTSGEVVAALSMRVSFDGRSGLVTLNASDPSPEITVPSAGNTFYVNTTADNTGTTTDTDDGTRCTVSSGGPTCTLRDAVVFANNDASLNISAGKSDTIMVPSGTYHLTWQAGTLDANANAVTHLEILGPVTIMGESTSGVIISGNNSGSNTDTVFTINPGSVGYYSTIGGSGASLAFDTALVNLTIENGKNANNPINSGTGLFNNASGGINWDAFGTGNLTLTNSTVENCSITWGDGGGIWAENSPGGGTGTLTISGSSISNNSTSESGGGIYIAFPPSALTVSNTTISGNKASITVNSSDPGGADGGDAGGGIFLTARPSGSGTPQTMLSGLTISSNLANGEGGGINTGTGMVLTTSVLSSNSSNFATSAGQSNDPDAFNGGGFWSEIMSPETTPTVTSTNFLSNFAYSAGGAIAVGSNTIANGNILQISLSRIFGNTSTNGASGLALGQLNGTGGVGEAIASNNWWGCNAGPLTSGDGCDQAAKYPTGASSGTLTVSPYAQFLLSATPPTTIPIGSSIGLNLSLNTNSNSQSIMGAFPAVSNSNYTYSFGIAGVTAALPSPGTLSTTGTGTATITPTSTGSGTVSATFDNQTDSVGITVNTTMTSVAITANPSTTYVYGQPSSFTVRLTPSNATGITTSDFAVQIGGSSVGYGLTLISNNNYQLTGPFNLINPALYGLKVSFAGTADYGASSTSVNVTVLQGSVNIGDTVTPTNPIQGQGGMVNVTVAATAGTGAVPAGSITYAFDGGTPSTVSLSSGAAAITIPTTIAAGNHSLALTYSGDTNYASATSTVTLTIYGRSQTTIAAITSTTATIDVFGFGFTPPSGTLAFTDVNTSTPVVPPVTLNTATATTALAPQMPTGTGTNTLPCWTELADVNGDGILDLITSLYITDSATVQLGNGDGTFQAATAIPIVSGFGPAEVHAVSLRGNGTLDLIVGSFNVNQIAVLLGTGSGGFGSPAFYTVGSSMNTPTSLTTGHFNGASGALDVAVANYGDNTITILTGNGSGALTAGSPINVGHAPEAIRSGDFNDDGYSDLAVANFSDGTVTTLLNNQNGTFTATVLSAGSGVHSGPQALAIHGSGTGLQLASANYKDDTVSVWSSHGNGTFGAQSIVNVGKGPDDVNFADFNGDGILDLAVSNYTDGTVDLLLGNTAAPYTLAGPFKVGNNPYSAAVGDIDLDGTPDVVVSNCFSNNTEALLDGTQIAVPYSGLSLSASNSYNGSYTPNSASKYGSSTSPDVTAP